MNAMEERVAVILTPEHVPVRLFPAGLGVRFMAVLVDTFIVMALLTLINMILQVLSPFGLKTAVATVVTFVVFSGYDIFFEVRRQGQTPGKKILGLRVVDGRGLPITFQQSFVRNTVRVLDIMPIFYGIGAFSCLLDPQQRRLGDLAAGTLVIQEHRVLDYAKDLPDARKFNTLQAPNVARRIRHDISLEEREFLLTVCIRAGRMNPQARFDLFEKVGQYYREKLGIDDAHISGENLVRGITSILYTKRA